MGLHGYNHVPLCLEEMNYNQALGYPAWSSTEAMELSVFELYTFAKDLFPENDFVTYVPASNILCEQSRAFLPQILPELRVISSVYLEEEAGLAYEQEFEEASDGIIEFPRVTAGYDPTEFMHWAALNELGLHYVNSHFVHPDDVYGVEHDGHTLWEDLRNSFEAYVSWLTSSAPGLRSMTAQEAGAAVQRFDRLQVNSTFDGKYYQMELENFYDEAWFIMRSSTPPMNVDGGTFTQVSTDLYLIEALQPTIIVQIME